MQESVKLPEYLSATLIRGAESWQFFAFVFAAIIALVFVLIDELPKKLALWRVLGKIGAFLLVGYFTLVNWRGRDFLVWVLEEFIKPERRIP